MRSRLFPEATLLASGRAAQFPDHPRRAWLPPGEVERDSYFQIPLLSPAQSGSLSSLLDQMMT